MVCPVTHFIATKEDGEKESVICYIPRNEERCLEHLKAISIHIEWETEGCLDTLSEGSWTKEGILYSSRDNTPFWEQIDKLRKQGKHKSFGDIEKEIENAPTD
jgi:hypothetical protein